MTRKFPVAIWKDAAGGFTARVLDGPPATAFDATAAAAVLQLKKYLAWMQRTTGQLRDSDFDDLRLGEQRIPVRPEYRHGDDVYPVSHVFQLRVACVHGQRADGTQHCVIPTLDLRFSYQPGDPLVELVAEAVQQALKGKSPQELSRALMPESISLSAVHVSKRGAGRRNLVAKQPALQAVAEPVGQSARGARVPRAIARDDLVRTVAERLTRDSSSLLLLGDSGVGKTTILVEAIRQTARQHRAASRAVAQRLQFWRTSGQQLIAGMKYLGQWEERCEQVIAELAEGSSVLCVDDLLELVRVGGREPGESVAAFLMPYLQRGELRLVGEASPSQLDACRRLLPGFADLFQVVHIPSLFPAEARALLEALLKEGARNLKLELEANLSDIIYRLFKRFQPYAGFPGRSATFVRQLLDQLAQENVSRLDQRRILARFQRETGLPEFLLRDDVPLAQAQVLADFRAHVLGQEDACRTAAGVVMALKTGLNDCRRPLGTLLFCGPTGVGKTEMAKALASYLFGAGRAADRLVRLVRLDMSEYAGYAAAQRLLLSAGGDVSDFIKRVRRQPFVVVLLDEIEKASPEVHDVLLGLLDEGRLTDRFGRTTWFQSAVIVMTSNLGAERSAVIGFDGSVQPAFERIAMASFRPEFFNRIDSVVTFQPLARETIVALALRELQAIGRREGLTKAGLQLAWTDAVVQHVASVGFDARYGARPLLRAIERLVVAPLARWLLDHQAVRGQTLSLQLTAEGGIVVE